METDNAMPCAWARRIFSSGLLPSCMALRSKVELGAIFLLCSACYSLLHRCAAIELAHEYASKHSRLGLTSCAARQRSGYPAQDIMFQAVSRRFAGWLLGGGYRDCAGPSLQRGKSISIPPASCSALATEDGPNLKKNERYSLLTMKESY